VFGDRDVEVARSGSIEARQAATGEPEHGPGLCPRPEPDVYRGTKRRDLQGRPEHGVGYRDALLMPEVSGAAVKPLIRAGSHGYEQVPVLAAGLRARLTSPADPQHGPFSDASRDPDCDRVLRLYRVAAVAVRARVLDERARAATQRAGGHLLDDHPVLSAACGETAAALAAVAPARLGSSPGARPVA